MTRGGLPVPGQATTTARRPESANLADILERVLDKGIVIAGDIRVNLLDIELLTIKIRLLVASVDKAREIGIDWWERDSFLSSGRPDLAGENRRLRRRIEALEARAGDRDGARPGRRRAPEQARTKRAAPDPERAEPRRADDA
ncbi:gas vesicle protein [Pseudonocardia hispaniensis]|uniref:Gas vesicle protein n=1 Tax=Pseudonocardia hispaniensis TaxID=904933 RepID=A0ABW1IXN3_9PSEU